MVTIYDIAQKTGFSAPTVSKVLNGTGSISEATRQQILSAAREMDYKPNMSARSLITKKSYLIGIIFEDSLMRRGFEHPLFGGVLNVFRQEMEKEGYDLIFLSNTSTNSAQTYLDRCRYRNVDAVVVINPQDKQDEILQIAAAGIPCISTNEIIEGVPLVITQNEQAGYVAGEHFIKNGHKNLGFIAGGASNYSRASTERLAGFRKALKDNGIILEESSVYRCKTWFRDEAKFGMKELLTARPDITGVFVSNDNMAAGAAECCEEMGLSIPNDISIIGFDDETLSSFMNPPLTTFRQDREQIAKTAVQMLLDMLKGNDVEECVRVPSVFVPRKSVKKLN